MLGKKIQNKPRLIPPVFFVLSLCLLYWLYVGYISQMIIAYDAVTYQDLGALIKEKGWIAYLRQGPAREPFYPFLVSVSMRLGEIFSVSYQTVQKFIQFLFLLATQLLTLRLLTALKIVNVLSWLVLLYIGFSPALLNTALSLYSEIAVMPFVPMVVLAGARAWQCLQRRPEDPAATGLRTIIPGAFLGLSLLLCTSVKAVFEVITPLFMLPFVLFLIQSSRMKRKKLFSLCLLFLLSFSLTYYAPLLSYKLANKKLNGHFTLTDRGAWPLYGNTVRRMEPLNAERFQTALATIPGEGLCQTLFGDQPCLHWTHRPSDDIGLGKLDELHQQGLSAKAIDKEMNKLSWQEALDNPAQYILLMLLEGLKMFFWESTNIGFVVYPEWLAQLYDSTILNWGLNFLTALLTVTAVIYALGKIWRSRREILGAKPSPEGPAVLLFFFLLLITPFIGLHTFFLVLKRYVLPLAPLYLVLIASFLQDAGDNFRKRR